MKSIYLAFTLTFLSILLNCNNTQLKESDSLKITKKTGNKEVFSLLKPINKPEEPLYDTKYKGYAISIKSNSFNQELVFKKGNIEITRILNFYYENPEIVFHLYESNLNNNIILIEGRDYYGSNLGLYYVDNKENRIIEIDDTISYTQDNPETKGFKMPKAEIIKQKDKIEFKLFLENKLLCNKIYNITAMEANDSLKNTVINSHIEESKQNQNISPSVLKGMWAVICANELTTLDINEDEGFLSLYDFNAIYINLKVEKWSNNEYILKYASVSSQQNYYEDRLGIIDEDIDKNKPIGKLTILSDGKAKLDWTGLYNTKKQKLEFVGKDFLLLRENGGKIPLILERCD